MKSPDRNNVQDILSLIPVQRAMLSRYLMDRADPVNFEQTALLLEGEVDELAFQRAWEGTVKVNEMLRSCFTWEKTREPLLLIQRSCGVEIEFHDLRHKTDGEQEAALEEYREADRRRGFDLRGIPFRVALHKLSTRKHVVTMSHHHILFDGWSTGVILHEFLQCYDAVSAGGAGCLPLKTPYKDYVKYLQQAGLDQVQFSEVLADRLRGWRESLGLGEAAEWKAPEAPFVNGKGGIEDRGRFRADIPDTLRDKLQKLSGEVRVSLSSLFYAALGVTLRRCHETAEIYFDTTVSGRNIPVRDVENIVGLFINTVPLRVNFLEGEGVLAFLERVHRRMLARTEFESIPAALLKEISRVGERGMGFECLAVVENYPLSRRLKDQGSGGGGLKITDYSFREATGHDLTVLINLLDRWEFHLSYRSSLFDANWAEGCAGVFMGCLEAFCSALAEDVSALLGDLPGLTAPVRRSGEGEEEFSGAGAGSIGYCAPETELEKRLARLWAEVLKRDEGRIGVDDNFFRCGGHSLHVTVLAARIQREFQTAAPLSALFRYPTIREFVRSCLLVGGKEPCPPVSPAPEMPFYPLSPAQRGMFFLQYLDGAGTAYNIPAAYRIRGPLDREKTERVFRELAARHESLRTSFFMRGEEPVQRIHGEADFTVDYMSYQGGAEGEGEPPDALLLSLIRPFNLAKPPLMRVTLIRLGHEDHLLFFDIHHIISDGTSAGLLIGEFSALMRGEAPLESGVNYRDYVCWLESDGQKAKKSRSREFWREVFKTPPHRTPLPFDFPRPEDVPAQGRRLEFMIPRALQLELNGVAERAKTTLFVVLLSVYGIMLSRLGGGDDVVTGVPAAGRDHADLQGIVGMFVNTLAIRLYPRRHLTFQDFLEETGRNVLAAFNHQDFPFGELPALLDLPRENGRNPLYDSMFALNNMEMPEFSIPGLEITPRSFRPRAPKLDLTVGLMETAEGISCHLEYNGNLFREETIRQIFRIYSVLCESAAEDTGVRLEEMPLMRACEKARLVNDFNDTAQPFPEDKTLQRLFLEQAERTPGQIAAVCSRAGLALAEPALFRDTYLTYAALERGSRLLAGQLRERGVKAGDIVAISASASLGGLLGVLAILRLGAAYLPMDPEFPAERVRFILADSGAAILVGDESAKEALAGESFAALETLYVSSQAPATEIFVENEGFMGGSEPEGLDGSGSGADHASRPGSLAYIIYTSGSTGAPKGVMVEHKSAVNVVTSFMRAYGVNGGDRILRQASLAFDVSVNEIFPILASGGAMVLPDKEAVSDFRLLLEIMRRYRISIFAAAPSLLSRINALSFQSPHLRLILSGGESLSLAHVDRLLEKAIVVNGYGPTETTICACCYHLTREKNPWGDAIPIGKPLMNYRFYIMDKDLELVPPGFRGELCIGGAGVARGYLNRPELTAEKFVETSEYGRIYRSGDLARRWPDGNIEFLGRLDDQVKIRGYRIEPAEVEKKLLEHEAVREAVAAVRQYENGENYLCAWVKGEGEGAAPGSLAARLRAFLLTSLPAYMAPSFIVEMESMPLNTSGKIDRRRLPAPDLSGGPEYRAPRDGRERKLAELFARTLGVSVEGVGIYHDFFRLGGHSLRAAALATAITAEFGGKIPVKDIFARPTVAALAEWISVAAVQAVPVIPAAEKRDDYPLTPAQRRVVTAQSLEPMGTAYNMTFAVILTGALDMERLGAAFASLVENHEGLRTSFHRVDGVYRQRIEPYAGFPLEHVKHTGDGDVESMLRSFIRPFDLGAAPLLRARVAELGPERHLLLTDMHHAIGDGVSAAILLKQLSGLYSGEGVRFASLCYRDYSEYINGPGFSGILGEQESWWSGHLSGADADEGLPADFPGSAWDAGDGDSFAFTLDVEGTSRLRRLARESGRTLFSVLFSVHAILLHKLSGSEDIITGMPSSGREHPQLAEIIGMFVNTLPIRTRPTGSQSFEQFLAQTDAAIRGALENQDYPLEALMARYSGNNPLFRTFFSFQAAGGGEFQLPGLAAEPVPVPLTGVKFDWVMDVEERGDTLSCALSYRTDLFRKESIARLARQFGILAEQAAIRPDIRLADLEIMTPEEREQVLYGFNRTDTPFVPENTLHGLFRERAKIAPEDTALLYPPEKGGRVEEVSYGELDACSDIVAGGLLKRGVRPGQIIGLWAERSVETIIGMLGIIKTGAAYLPLDPSAPAEQTQWMLADSATVLTLRKRDIMKFLCDVGGDIASLLAPLERIPFPEAARLTAYVMYTSGSSGRPKGVAVSHRNVANLAGWFGRRYELEPGRRVAQMTSCTFDPSVEQIFGVLSHGCMLCLVPARLMGDISLLREYLDVNRVDTVNFTPSFLEILLTAGPRLSHVRTVISGGEALTPELRDRWLRMGYRVFNHYGPTETTVDAAAGECVPEVPGEMITIGRPVDNVRCYILDRYLKPAPVGAAGELYIGGEGVSAGYLNNPEATAGCFIANPFHRQPDPVLFKTGDRASWTANGEIRWLGRLDQQIKLRGCRIELSGIESALAGFPGVARAAVTALRSPSVQGDGISALCAYVSPKPGARLDCETLRHYLSLRLPGYMIPSFFVILEELPLTTGGKIDRRALPEPERGKTFQGESPRDVVEEGLAEIMGELVPVKAGEICIDDDFFRLGGNSLAATALAVRVSGKFRVDLPVPVIFKTPTIRALAEYLRSGSAKGHETRIGITHGRPDGKAGEKAAKSCRSVGSEKQNESPGQGRPAENAPVLLRQSLETDRCLFLIHDGAGGVETYIDFCNCLEIPFNCWGVRAPVPAAEESPTISRLAAASLDAVRGVQEHGPYYIAGWSLGGVIAFEMVRALENAGEKVAFFGMIDSFKRPENERWDHFLYPGSGRVEQTLSGAPGDAAALRRWAEEVTAGCGAELESLIPGSAVLKPEELTQRLEVLWLLNRAWRQYEPSGKIHSPVYYFKARESGYQDLSSRYWRKYAKRGFITRQVAGDHYSIFRRPLVRDFADTFSLLLRESCHRLDCQHASFYRAG